MSSPAPTPFEEACELLRHAYRAFNARDIDDALALMHDDVDWPNGMEGGRVEGREAVRAYWLRQFELIQSHVEPVEFSQGPGGAIAVRVHQVVRNPAGEVLSDRMVGHVYHLRDGLVARMDIVA